MHWPCTRTCSKTGWPLKGSTNVFVVHLAWVAALANLSVADRRFCKTDEGEWRLSARPVGSLMFDHSTLHKQNVEC